MKNMYSCSQFVYKSFTIMVLTNKQFCGIILLLSLKGGENVDFRE